jgi:large subunit ribosomal protein L17
MRHLKDKKKLSRTSSHRRCLMANMLKSLIEHGRIQTTEAKAKVLKRYADKMVTLAKKNDLASRRRAIAEMMVTYNTLTPKQKRAVKEKDDKSSYNTDRIVIQKLFSEIGPRFMNREGGYTRIIKTERRVGDDAALCVIEYLSE